MDFVVLPDSASAAVVAGYLPPDSRRLNHSSGRPWLVGTWGDQEITVVEAGTRRLAIIGRSPCDTSYLTTRLANLRSLEEADAIARSLLGSVYLCISLDGQLRLQGSVLGIRQVFWTTIDGVTVAANTAETLTRLTRPGIEVAVLASMLLSPAGAPWPLCLKSVYSSISLLRNGSWLSLGRRKETAEVAWWSAPQEERSLEEAAAGVAKALLAALRIRSQGAVSADLSGGLDSTSLCFALLSLGADLLTQHVVPLDPANADTAWATRAALLMPSARHLVLPSYGPERWFDSISSTISDGAGAEGPATWIAGRSHVEGVAGRAMDNGAQHHVVGLGGDELFGLLPAYPWSYARRRPLSGLRDLNRYRMASRWGATAMTRAVLDRTSFADALRRAAGEIALPVADPDRLDLGWLAPIRMPPWATRDAVHAVRSLFLDTAQQTPKPLDADRTRHQILASLVFEASTIRHANAWLAASPVAWDAPLLDDRVVEAALSVRLDERLISGEVKPMLVRAMRGIAPAGALERRDKGEFSAEAYQGLRANRDRLVEFFEYSQLEELGLIDRGPLLKALVNPSPLSHHLAAFDATAACESWLRAQDQSLCPASRGQES